MTKISAMIKATTMRQASTSFFWLVVPTREFMETQHSMANDEQSQQLFTDVCEHLNDKLKLSEAENEAMSRVMQIVKNRKSWKPDLVRNNVFKAAHSLGLKLPSHMF